MDWHDWHPGSQHTYLRRAELHLQGSTLSRSESTIQAKATIKKAVIMVQAVLKALREREAQLLTVQAIEADISKRQKALALLEEQVSLLHPVYIKENGEGSTFCKDSLSIVTPN